LTGKGNEKGFLSDPDIRELVSGVLADPDFDGKRVIAIVPDLTRTAPIPLMFRLLCETLGARASKLDFLVALGTHPPLDDERMNKLFGITPEERAGRYSGIGLFNHTWDEPETLRTIGMIPASEIREISGGLMDEDVPVSVNGRILEYDHIIIVGPTFPHEVVGFSGGNKYFFPGIAGGEVLNFFHWLGAVITNVRINGTKDTPVRKVVDRAASFINVPKLCFSLVVTHDGVKGVYAGTPEEAWSSAADLSAKVHIVYKEHTFKKVLGIAPKMYDDIWVAGKVMYKLEPVIEDGGDLIIYAPHIDEVSYTHGKFLDETGYHVRDYFLLQMDQFAHVSGAVMAHSTHVKGLGTFEDGMETPRVNVILATSIPEERCRRINLGYVDPASIDISEWENREDEGILLVRNAGEVLYRLTGGRLPG
jgi:nickel-dependent lactate racemase